MPELRLVRWIDSAHEPGWVAQDDVDLEIASCVSVGYVLVDDAEQVLLAQTIDVAHEMVTDVMAIPKVAITSSVVLRKGSAA